MNINLKNINIIDNKDIDEKFEYFLINLFFSFLASSFILMIPMAIIGLIITFIIDPIFSLSETKCNYLFLIIFLILVILLTLILQFKYKIFDETEEERIKIIQKKLNKKYVDVNDKEKIYLLHEIIKKEGLNYSLKDQINSNDLELKIKTKTSNNNYKKFNRLDYEDEDVYNILNKEVAVKKQISFEEVKPFFNEYIEPYLQSKQKSFDEKEKTYKKLLNKNNINF